VRLHSCATMCNRPPSRRLISFKEVLVADHGEGITRRLETLRRDTQGVCLASAEVIRAHTASAGPALSQAFLHVWRYIHSPNGDR
jgi:hypothetical protein